MLAGIGLIIIAGQLYALAAAVDMPAGNADKILKLPSLIGDLIGSANARSSAMIGLGVIAIIVTWSRLPARVRIVPAALVAVALAAAATAWLRLPIAMIEIRGLSAAIQPPDASRFVALTDLGLLTTIVAFTLIASAESLFSAAAIDRLHTGARTQYNKELIAQGAGNAVCGLLGALPMTAVIVRSAANVDAGAKTRASRVFHGVWLLLFTAMLPTVLGLIPTAALSGLLLYAGWKLLPVSKLVPMWREHRGEATVLVVTAAAILTAGMLEGVVIGLLAAVIKTAWETSHVHIAVEDRGHGPIRVTLAGSATFLRLPKMLDTLEPLPAAGPIELDLSGLRHLDHACRTALTSWAQRRNDSSDNQPVQLIHAA